MTYATLLSTQLKIPGAQVASTIELLDADNTVPFIARYRKEATDGLDEEQIRQIQDGLAKQRALDERRETVIKSIEEQGKMTPELHQLLLGAGTMTALEDLYQPYKPKRRTRASIAREKGLQPLADLIIQQKWTNESLERLAKAYLNEQVPTVDDAWAGSRDIVAEAISDHADVRRITRQKALDWGTLTARKIEDAVDERRVYEIYYEFEQRVDRVRPHQVLAFNRGEAEKVLRVAVQILERDWRGAIENSFRPDPRSPLADQLQAATDDAAERLLLPAIERDVRRELTERAEMHAINVFGLNLRGLLGQPPLAGYHVLGIDPGFRTGCKVAVVDATGKLLDTATIYPHEPQKKRDDALKTLGSLAARHKVTLISIGNGTASRETEQLAVDLIQILGKAGMHLQYIITNEAGASVYSASPLARAEFPDLDVSIRGAVSIARRVQDPLAELVKIEPKAIGVGMYQHDVDQKRLAEALTGVVESVVNQVGVDLNTASAALLTYVSGVGQKLAERVVAYRDEHGAFKGRQELRKVQGLGPKAFEQAAGFLRVRGGDEPLDASAIHPESYKLARKVMDAAHLSLQMPPAERKTALDALLIKRPLAALAADLGAGVPTLTDILDQLVRPGRDPREDAPAPILRADILKMEDLAVGMRLKGTVRNVVDFGAFVDIGVKQDGLLHRSQVPQGTVLGVGDLILVEIQRVEIERGRISLMWVSKSA